MCAAELHAGDTPPSSVPGRSSYGTIVVVGGGCYGTYYVRQLRRAARAGVLSWKRLLVVDRNPACAVAAQGAEPGANEYPVEIVASDWGEFLAGYLGDTAGSPDEHGDDAIVPSPLMPHLMSDWLMQRARARWPERSVGPKPLPSVPPVPWERAGADGSAHYVSFAEWTCPTNCVEPRLCPITRGERSWSLPPTLRAWTESEREAGREVEGPLLFHCSHRAYGVGMLDTSEITAADRLIAAAGTEGGFDVLIGTVSHCHGALTLVSVGAPPGG